MNSRSITTQILCMVFFSLVGIASASKIDDVRANVYAWGQSWQSQDINSYMSFYSPAFRSKGLDYQGWRQRKTKHFRKTDDIRLEISDLSVFIEGRHATARFVLRYQDSKFSDVGEQTLTIVKEGDKWLIVSEEWRPLKVPGTTKGRMDTSSNSQILGIEAQAVDKAEQGHEIKTLPPNKIIVKGIKYKIEKDREKVFITLNNFSTPKILTLEGDKPRIVIDIKNVSSWSGHYRTPVNGKLIKQIRTFLHHDTEKLRIVLDLNPSENYSTYQIYYQTENIYCIEVR
jgi:ketosteroid isomerase-like protein